MFQWEKNLNSQINANKALDLLPIPDSNTPASLAHPTVYYVYNSHSKNWIMCMCVSGGHELHEEDPSWCGSLKRPGGWSWLPGAANRRLRPTHPGHAAQWPHWGPSAHQVNNTTTKLATGSGSEQCPYKSLCPVGESRHDFGIFSF